MATERHTALARLFNAGSSFATTASFAAVLLAAQPAGAGMVDPPPKVWTFKLDDPSSPKLSLLRAFQNAAVERPGPLRRYLGGTFGQWRQKPWWTLVWKPIRAGDSLAAEPSAGDLLAAEPAAGDLLAAEPSAGDALDPSLEAFIHRAMPLRSGWAASTGMLFGFEPREPQQLHLEPSLGRPSLGPAALSFTPAPQRSRAAGPRLIAAGFDALWAKPGKPIRDWRCRRRPVVFSRYGSETRSFDLVRCDGSVAPGALDRLSLMARPPDVPNPGELLPDEPDPQAWQHGEWLPGVRLVHPRVLWLLQRIADAFPFRPIYIFSGYRPGALVGRGGSHPSLHAGARAMDIQVYGIPNAVLFQFCRTLDDVGCGYYPNSKFVHVDVRRPGSGHPFWIDASRPGEPSRYVDAWPGVVESGGAIWDTRRDRGQTD